MKSLFFQCLALLCAFMAHSQAQDTVRSLEEVIVIAPKKDLNLRHAKPLATLDEFLDSGNVGMIRRGTYAWEPMINGMATERTLITIEGMHIFGACTDKMDPITSYVEVSNLNEANLASGQQGAQFGATIGGAVDLRRNRTGFAELGLKTIGNLGYETNGSQKIAGAGINYSTRNFFIDTDIMFRNADDYRAGNNKKIPFSQFSKVNASVMSAIRTGRRSQLEASVILDRATDVGYPALPMDVSLAEAVIASLRYEVAPADTTFQKWETKVYVNAVTHIMDDTQRPDVPMHMDMPGRTRTLGAYSLLTGARGKHKFRANFNGYYNASLAEMTMYPEDSSQSEMFMLTWPDVRTVYSGLFVEDAYEFHCHSVLKVSAAAGWHSNSLESDFGLSSLRIFYPEMQRTRNRMLKNLSANYRLGKAAWFSLGGAYGERAPSVSEGYGFYLFNSFDNHDYIGNPNLPNEKSLEANASAGYDFGKSSVKVQGNYFYIIDYIIARPREELSPMTLGAAGVRAYESTRYAQIVNVSASMELQLHPNLRGKAKLTYGYGADDRGGRLPLIAPLDYAGALQFKKGRFMGEATLRGNAIQTRYAPEFGEDRTPAFAILDASAGYNFALGAARINCRAGVENVFDAYYSTFSDWNNLPRKGRNLYVNLVVLK